MTSQAFRQAEAQSRSVSAALQNITLGMRELSWLPALQFHFGKICVLHFLGIKEFIQHHKLTGLLAIAVAYEGRVGERGSNVWRHACMVSIRLSSSQGRWLGCRRAGLQAGHVMNGVLFVCWLDGLTA